jgi:hypothetical protein
VHSTTKSISTGRRSGVASLLLMSALCFSNAQDTGAPDNSTRQPRKLSTQVGAMGPQTGVSTPTGENSPRLPAPLAGVSDLKFGELFNHPVGPRGLAFSRRAEELDGKRVRMVGYMVEQERPVPGQFLFCQSPMVLHEEEYGFCEDLPPTVVHVLACEKPDARPIPHIPGLLALNGTLLLGNRPESDGRISAIRLRLDQPQCEGEPQALGTPKAAPVAQSSKPELSVQHQTKEQKEKKQ